MATGPITLDCAFLGRDAGTVNRLARLQLMARRNGSRLRLTNGDERLLELVRFCGLAAVLGVEPGRQPE